MSLNIKLDADGSCNLCKKTSLPNEHVGCFICYCQFHAVCPNVGADHKLATKTTISNFNFNSTKKNFMFLCDACLTKFERINADSDGQRINTLESQIGNVDKQLSEIKKLLEAKSEKPAQVKETNKAQDHQQKNNSIWFDKEKLAKIKAPTAPSVLIIGNGDDSDASNKNHIDLVERVIMENNIAFQQTYKNKKGEVVIVCDSEESRNNLHNIVSNTDKNVPIKTPKGKSPSVSIVGVPKEYSEAEINEMLVKQNDFIRRFASANKIEEHFKVFAVRPTKKNPHIFQVFATVSQVLRDGIQQFNDKLTLGLTSCKVYDQYHIKRCYKCQNFGHYSKECTSQEEICAKCGDNHDTKNCTATLKRCINCVRDKSTTHDHFAFDPKCPAMIKQQNSLKRKLNNVNLNLARYKMTQIT